MAKPKPLARLADNLLEGGLADFIVARRADGKSWDTIAKELWVATDYEIDVTGVTVQKWDAHLSTDQAAS